MLRPNPKSLSHIIDEFSQLLDQSIHVAFDSALAKDS